MSVFNAIWDGISWLVSTAFACLTGLVGFLLPPRSVGSCIVVVAISVFLTWKFTRGGRTFPTVVSTGIICLVGTSFVWNVTSWLVLTKTGPLTFEGNRDAVVTRVGELVEQINETQAGVAETHKKLTQALAVHTPNSMASGLDRLEDHERASPNDLMEIVEMLIEEGQLAMELHENLLYSIRAYSGVLPEAKLVCQQAADHQRELAGAERYAELKDTYLAAARYFDALADRIGRSAGDIALPEAEVTENAKYVSRAVVFLQHFREDLAKVPEFPGPEMHAELIRAIQKFVADFERFRAALDGFGKAIPAELPPVALPASSSTT